MLWLILLIVIVIAAFIVLKLKLKDGRDDGDWPFYAKKLLSQPEQILYFRLINALPEHIVLAQVQLSRFLGVKKGNNIQAWYNRINRMSADFLVCNKDSSVIAAIELDDSSHQKSSRQAADIKKNKAIGSAGIPIIRWQTNTLPDEATIQSTIQHSQRMQPMTNRSSSG
jgi:very-short-patch-repair endonuclease